MSLKTVTEKIDVILHVGVLALCGIIWAVVGFPYLMEVVVAAGLITAGFLIWWLISRRQKKI
jgi:ABC-type enterochelin transport system permease subunit